MKPKQSKTNKKTPRKRAIKSTPKEYISSSPPPVKRRKLSVIKEKKKFETPPKPPRIIKKKTLKDYCQSHNKAVLNNQQRCAAIYSNSNQDQLKSMWIKTLNRSSDFH